MFSGFKSSSNFPFVNQPLAMAAERGADDREFQNQFCAQAISFQRIRS
jgi:hypothetical protein